MHKLGLFYIFFFSTIYSLLAQNLLNCTADLQWQNSKEGEKRSVAVLIFDKASNELIGDISLLPLLNNPDLRDSLENVNPPFHLIFRGQFPINQPEFFSAAENEKQVNIDARIQLGDSVFYQPINMVLTMIRDKSNVAPSGMETSVLPCRANFVLLIDPRKFGLHLNPVKWTKKFTVEVDNGVINRR